MSFEKNSLFSEQLDSKKPQGSKKSKPPKKEAEGLDDLFGNSKKDKNDRLDIKTW
jgi:hypothetical protein